MANYTTLPALFSAIANEIRAKNNTTDTIIADNFPTEIENLKSEFDYINNTVTAISDYQFQNQTQLASVNCNNLISIGTSAFENCPNLSIIELPNTVTSIGENAINDCPYVVVFSKHSSQPNTWNVNWNPDNRPVFWGDPIEIWDISKDTSDSVFGKLYQNNNTYSLVIVGRGDIKGFNGYSAADWSNFSDNLTNITVATGITTIGRCAFCWSNITNFEIPNGVTEIDDSCFHGCSLLTTIKIPKTLTYINSSQFANCKNLTNIIIDPDNPKYQVLNGHLYTKDTLELVDVAGGLTDLIIPEGIVKMHNTEHYTDIKIKNISIPSTMTVISSGQVFYSDLLETITVHENNPSFKAINNIVYNKNGTKIIGVASTKTTISIDNNITAIGDGAFYNCSITQLTIPDSVTNIGVGAFSKCTKLTDIILPNNLTRININTFDTCTSLTTVTLPNNIISLDYGAFWNCSNLRTINIPNTIQNISSRVFSNCPNLRYINYNGTMAEWDAITKSLEWDGGNWSGNYTIYCTDGNIPKAS